MNEHALDAPILFEFDRGVSFDTSFIAYKSLAWTIR